MTFIGMTIWAKPAATTGEGEQELMATVRVADTAAAMGKVATLEITMDYLGNDEAEEI